MGLYIKQILALIYKELCVILLDPVSRLSIFMPPLIQLLLFSFAATLDVKNVSIGIYNKDGGGKSFDFIERFRGTPVFEKITTLKSERQVRSFIDAQKGLVAIVIDEEFSKDLGDQKEGKVELIFDGRRANSAQILLGYINQIISDFNLQFIGKPKVELVPRNWFNPNIIYLWYNIPCLVSTLAMISCLVVTTQSVSRERELGTLDQLLISPLTMGQIITGKLIPGMLVGLVEALFMVFVGVFVLGIPFVGSFSLFFLSLVVFVIATSGIGIFISALSATQQMAMLGSFVCIMPSILLSGFATPVEAMPTWLQPLTDFIALKYMLIISKGVFLKNISLQTSINNILPMIWISLATIFGGILIFRKRLS